MKKYADGCKNLCKLGVSDWKGARLIGSHLSAVCLMLIVLLFSGNWSLLAAKAYEAPANYREQINELKEKFKKDYGYDLLDLDEGWTSDDIVKMDKVFSELPKTFYRLPGLNGLYRTEQLRREASQVAPEDIPAAAFPSFITIYRQVGTSYNVYIEDEDPRVELYNSLQYESPEDLANIVHHEMGHAFDLTNGFLSFSAEWLALSHFRVINIPALDGQKDSDYIYALVNDVGTDVYAPVSSRHLPTYSRQNPQEDFANSVAAYIHYPYFQYSHPDRYRFMKDKVFGGKEYFPSGDAKSYEDKVLSDMDQAIGKSDWDEVVRIAVEVSRAYHPQLQVKVIARLGQAVQASVNGDSIVKLGVASCLLYEPESLELRQNLVRSKKVAADVFAKDEYCARVGREMYENVQVNWPVLSVYFYREGDANIVQFLDPALLTSHLRGFDSIYTWRLFLADSPKKPIAEGQMVVGKGSGAVKIDLGKTLKGKLVLPEGELLELEIGVKRQNIKTFKTFESPVERTRFVVQPWFKYMGDSKIKVVYPVRPAYHGK